MNKTLALSLLLLLFLCIAKAQTKPNIVFILVDDQGWNDLSVLSHQNLEGSKSNKNETPNINAIGLQGMRFSNAYASAAVCSPSRNSIQSGISPSSLNITSNLTADNVLRFTSAESLANTIKKIDPSYSTAHLGKWHVKRNPDDMGYDYWHGGNPEEPENTGLPPEDGEVLKDGAIIHENPKLIYSITDEANKFITEQVEANKPFFVEIHHHAPHGPFMCTREMYDKYADKLEGVKYAKPVLAGMTEDLDRGIGMVLDTLKKLGIYDNTYVIYTSDNGSYAGGWLQEPAFGLPNPYFGGKGNNHQGGIRVPFFIKGPGIEANSWNNIPIIGYDIFPTICDILGGIQKVPASVEGASFLTHCLERTEDNISRNISCDGLPFVYYNHFTDPVWNNSAYIKGDYKMLIEHKEGQDDVRLYKLSEDVGEQTNLAINYPDTAAVLLKEWYDYVEEKNISLESGSLEDAKAYMLKYYPKDDDNSDVGITTVLDKVNVYADGNNSIRITASIPDLEYTVFDISGKEIKSGYVENETTKINVPCKSAYVLSFQTKNIAWSKKVVVW